MNQLSLSMELSAEIRALARKATEMLPASCLAGEFARRGAARPIDYMRFAEFEAVLRDLQIAPGMTVLDISSPQWFSIYLAYKNPDATFVYTNIMDSELDPFREIAAKLQLPNLRYEKADARALEFESNTIDRVISISVIEHIYPEVGGDVLAIKDIARVLKRGGRLLVTVPYKETRNIVYQNAPVYERKEVQHNFFAREYDKHMFDQLVAASPLELENTWFICEKKGLFALDYYEWGPGKDVQIAKLANKIRQKVERVIGISMDESLAAKYLDVTKVASARLVNVSAKFFKS